MIDYDNKDYFDILLVLFEQHCNTHCSRFMDLHSSVLDAREASECKFGSQIVEQLCILQREKKLYH